MKFNVMVLSLLVLAGGAAAQTPEADIATDLVAEASADDGAVADKNVLPVIIIEPPHLRKAAPAANPAVQPVEAGSVKNMVPEAVVVVPAPVVAGTPVGERPHASALVIEPAPVPVPVPVPLAVPEAAPAPAQKRPARDAITGKPVERTAQPVREESLRDRVRNKIRSDARGSH